MQHNFGLCSNLKKWHLYYLPIKRRVWRFQIITSPLILLPLPSQSSKSPAAEENSCSCSTWEIITCYGRSYLGQVQWGNLVSDLMKRLHLMRGLSKWTGWLSSVGVVRGHKSAGRKFPSSPPETRSTFLMLICHIAVCTDIPRENDSRPPP